MSGKQEPPPWVVRVQAGNSRGSGFVVSSSCGWRITIYDGKCGPEAPT